MRWEIQTLKPIQISNIDLDDYIYQRRRFKTDEWIVFLMHTMGLNPEAMNAGASCRGVDWTSMRSILR